MTGYNRHPASFRDPSGFVFHADGKYFRQINKSYAGNYDLLMRSGLYDNLTSRQYLLAHTEIKENISGAEDCYVTLLPEQLSFISYPYEWCFEQLKDAALLTLKILKIAVEKKMILKDATPFNIQFSKGHPVFIDTLSFEKYDASLPWIAYRQFCELFLFPLWLSHYHKVNFQQILSVYPDGISAEIAAKLLPAKSRLSSSVWLHLLLQNTIKKQTTSNKIAYSFSEKKLLDLITHLENIIRKLDNSSKTTWSNYYDEGIDEPAYLDEKKKIISQLLSQVHGKKIIDLGANDGEFSFLSAEKGFTVIATDNDEQCISNFYKKIRKKGITNILPLCIDIANPSAATGFANKERTSINDRLKGDAVMALALIHHLAIGKNIPLQMLAAWLSELAPQLIIEFISKDDKKTQLLLQNKKDIFSIYTKENFENIFQQYFSIVSLNKVGNTSRFIYLMKKK
jgi:2-polyprenyl-3-methyl-5-hydroxy-6-metoxy-1,4-benzoquinol methylase